MIVNVGSGRIQKKGGHHTSQRAVNCIWLGELSRTSIKTAEIWNYTPQIYSFTIWVE